MQIVRLLAIATVATIATACGTSEGGGWIPSAVDPTQKAVFGFAYSCDASTNHLQGRLTYHDLGSGHMATVAIDQPVPAVYSCTTPTPGGTAACGIVQHGSGGVSPGDIVLVAMGDGAPTGVEDAMEIAMFAGDGTDVCTTAIENCASATTEEEFANCLNLTVMGDPYYVNVGNLGAGNIRWTE